MMEVKKTKKAMVAADTNVKKIDMLKPDVTKGVEKTDVIVTKASITTYVYFIEEAESGNIKIGVAKTIEKRIKQLQTGNPRTLTAIAFITCKSKPDAHACETFLHKKFASVRLHGEWFNIGRYHIVKLHKRGNYCPADVMETSLTLSFTWNSLIAWFRGLTI